MHFTILLLPLQLLRTIEFFFENVLNFWHNNGQSKLYNWILFDWVTAAGIRDQYFDINGSYKCEADKE